MRHLSAVTFTAALALAFAACEGSVLTPPEATTPGQANVHNASQQASSTTLPMEFDPAEFAGSPFEPFVGPIEGDEAHATITRRSNGTLTIVLIDHGPWAPGDMFHRWKPLAFDFLWATFEAP